jgi:DNA-binding response OmpR family regulator
MTPADPGSSWVRYWPFLRPRNRSGPRAGTIVVLGADVSSCTAVRDLLALRGHRVECTHDPGAARASARGGGVDLLLVDGALGLVEEIPRGERRRTDPPPNEWGPARPGYAALRPLGALSDPARFPAVFLKESGPAHPSGAPRFALVDFVPRPFTPPALLAVVEAALPARGAALGLGPSPALPFAALPKPLLKALVVDGDREYRQFLHALLEPHGFEVHGATNGQEGLAATRSLRPGLILSEVNLPGMDGFEFCRRLRAHALTRDTPLVFLSAWDDHAERYHGLRLGAHDYASKQTAPRELLIRLQLVLRRSTEAGWTVPRAPMEGELGVIGAIGMLQMCHLARFSGVCTVRTGRLHVRLRFSDGEIVGAESSSARGKEAVYELVSWSRGHFGLLPGDPGEGAPLGSFDHLVLEGCRRLDEERREG